MNISRIIREQRNKLSLSQEDLGEKVYVTRQTISNWENDKSYPDINSLILLSLAFDMTIDNLVKGDLEIMEHKIEEQDIRFMKRYSRLTSVGLYSALLLLPLSVYLWSIMRMLIILIAALVMEVIDCIILLYYGRKIEKMKSKYDLQTFREITAFFKGETLDEITKIRESGKKNYQKFLSIAGTIIVALIMVLMTWFIFMSAFW